MTHPAGNIVSRVRHYRQKAKLSQSRLARCVGLKRQAIYDIESGRYLPNTLVALRLARHFGCRVEDLFFEDSPGTAGSVVMGEGKNSAQGRVSVVRVRDQLVVYPAEGSFSFATELRPADGILEKEKIRFFGKEAAIENSILLLGCDPAFSLLAAHLGRSNPELRMMCRFASTYSAMDRLKDGKTHIAGIHLHSGTGEDANTGFARQKLAGTGATLVGYSVMEEGVMVARGNPFGIGCAADLARKDLCFINREPGAALRILLDEELDRAGIPVSAIPGYDQLVYSHDQGAQMITWGRADATLGLAPVARANGLDFVPIAEVRCDLVIPGDIVDIPQIQSLLNIVQSRDLRDEIGLLPGYSPAKTGTTIDTFAG